MSNNRINTERIPPEAVNQGLQALHQKIDDPICSPGTIHQMTFLFQIFFQFIQLQVKKIMDL